MRRLVVLILLNIQIASSFGGDPDEFSRYLADSVIEWRGVFLIVGSVHDRIREFLGQSAELRQFVGIPTDVYENAHDWHSLLAVTDARQRDRLLSVLFFSEGLLALRHADIAALIDLEDEYRRKAQDIWDSRHRVMFYFAASNSIEALAAWRMVNSHAEMDVAQLLTPRHKANVVSLLRAWRPHRSAIANIVSYNGLAPRSSAFLYSALPPASKKILMCGLVECCHHSLRRHLLMLESGVRPSKHVASIDFARALRESERLRSYILGDDASAGTVERVNDLLSASSHAHLFSLPVWGLLHDAEQGRVRVGIMAIEGAEVLLRPGFQRMCDFNVQESEVLLQSFAEVRDELWQLKLGELEADVKPDDPAGPLFYPRIFRDAEVSRVMSVDPSFHEFRLWLGLIENLPISIIEKCEVNTEPSKPYWKEFSEIGVLP